MAAPTGQAYQDATADPGGRSTSRSAPPAGSRRPGGLTAVPAADGTATTIAVREAPGPVSIPRMWVAIGPGGQPAERFSSKL